MGVTRNTKILAAIIAVSALLFVFVLPEAINGGINWIASSLPSSVAGRLAHVPVVPFRLGLDLVGGAHLQYEADFSGLGDVNKAEAMEGVRDVVERRVNYFGVAEPVVQVTGENRLIVEIAGITDIDEAIKLIGETPFLEFREQDLTAEGEVIQSGQLVNGEIVPDPWSGWKPTGLSGKHVRHASLFFDPQTRQPEVLLELNEEGTTLFAEITRRNLGKPVAIFLDGQPISIPIVQSEINDGNAIISGNFTPSEAKQLVGRLNSGALPVPIRLIGQKTIGASLGQESLDASLRAGMWGLGMVALFMVVFYRLPGATSIVALGVYTLAVLAVYKLLPVTLTLAGIAGFILSLGIGVDANVLIFARMREELAAGKPLMTALREGFRRSWPSIRDSHVTTFIGAAVLYVFTTSIVKGFALTLGIGVILSLLTSTIVTRTFLVALASTRLTRWRWLFS
jgi:preprotein translocase subunit SecD